MAQMTDKQSLDTLRALIKEVKQEKRKALTEGKEQQVDLQQGETLKEYVTRSLMEVIRESGG